jgi:hypothetical protein
MTPTAQQVREAFIDAADFIAMSPLEGALPNAEYLRALAASLEGMCIVPVAELKQSELRGAADGWGACRSLLVSGMPAEQVMRMARENEQALRAMLKAAGGGE